MWLSLSYFGVDAFRRRLTARSTWRCEAERLIGDEPELELMSPAQLGIVCFRRRFAGAAEGVAVGATERGAGRAL